MSSWERHRRRAARRAWSAGARLRGRTAGGRRHGGDPALARRRGEHHERHVRNQLLGDPQAISALTEQVMEFLQAAGVDPRDRASRGARVGRAPDQSGNPWQYRAGTPATLRLTVETDRVTTEIIDAGTSFDPRQAPDPDLSARHHGARDRRPRPYLVRQFADGHRLRRRGETNFTTFAIARSRT